MLIVGIVVTIFVWQAVDGIRHSVHQDNATSGSADIALLQIDINQCQSRELSLLPNVGPVLAERMIADRKINGPFATVDDLKRVHGIGAKTVARISPYCIAGKTAPALSAPDSLVAATADSR